MGKTKIYTTNTEYDFYLSEWNKAKHFYTNEKLVKQNANLYVPKLNGQDDNEYNDYISYGCLTMYFKKVVNTYVGMVTRKPVQIFKDSEIENLEEVTPDKKNMDDFVYDVLLHRFQYGRCGILVDYLDEDSRSYFSFYDTFSILEVRYDRYGSLSKVVLEEEDRYIELVLEEGVYVQNHYDKDTENIMKTVTPIKNGKVFDYIPFIIIGDYVPLLTEILDLNVYHYRLSVDLGYGLHWTAIPTPVVTGISNQDDVPDFIGASQYISIPAPDGKAFFMEFQGVGLSSISDRMETVENNISKLTVNMMLDNINQKTATQSLIEHNSSVSSVIGIVNDIARDLTIAVNIMKDWNDMETGYVVVLNTDFMSRSMDPSLLRELTNMLLSNTISYETYWDALQKGEIVSEEKTAEDEQNKINLQTP
jgi:hypothetical protein